MGIRARSNDRRRARVWLAFAAVAILTPFARGSERPADIRFNRDARPILSDNCFACHGPDKNKRKADLRLDTKEGLFGKLEKATPVVPGHPGQSEIIRRITSTDPEEVMPPPKSTKKLTAAQIELLKQWVEEGAPWEGHWSFTPPTRPPVPVVKVAGWVRNPMDAFILQRLEAEGLHPSKEADKVTLIRRLGLDLTGLPPTIAEVDAFLADSSADAYEKVVDRLMASPHYGERLALDWLDAARFADTHGYHIDAGRDMTRWRAWAIDAFNRNQPFDQFTIEQLAGDLLPNATTDQQVASGFNRNHMVNFEGGAIPEEYRTQYVLDRTNTTGTVWLGLTVGCSQCHDHKFDPLTQKEFYQLFAFFNNVAEIGLDGKAGNAAPTLKLQTPEQKKQFDEWADEKQRIEKALAGAMPEVDAAQMAWEQDTSVSKNPSWALLNPITMASANGATLTRDADKSIIASGPNPPTDVYTVSAATEVKKITALRLELLPDPKLAGGGPGRSANGNIVLTEIRVTTREANDEGDGKPAAIAVASADFSQSEFAIANAIDGVSETGWGIDPKVGKAHTAVFEFEKPIAADGAVTLCVTLEFKSTAAQHQAGRFRLSVTDAVSPGLRKPPPPVAKALALDPPQRSNDQVTTLRDYYRREVSPECRRQALRLARVTADMSALDRQIPTTMVMSELAKPRETFMLMRGQYDKPGDKVAPGVPAFLPPLPKDAPANRLALARWLVDERNPLTARVTVNRFWQMFFGTGIVKTAEDFGTQGEPPSNPQLLDWLATEFVEPSVGVGAAPASPARIETTPASVGAITATKRVQAGVAPTQPWDINHLVRLIVTSATYRQSSAVNRQLIEKDPENRLLARGPRFRLPAEFIRDQALFTAGLLDDRVGGASVLPYQPPGLWEELMSRGDGEKFTAQVYVQSHGPDLYRRTMYTFWKRTSPPPTLMTFDAPDRELCTVRRARTNTPLQALVLMNDPTYVEASRKLAERAMNEAGDSADRRIEFIFRTVLSRKPTHDECATLKEVFEKQSDLYRNDPVAAEKLLKVGESPRNEKLNPAELAAWTTLASVVLNLDEAVTKG